MTILFVILFLLLAIIGFTMAWVSGKNLWWLAGSLDDKIFAITMTVACATCGVASAGFSVNLMLEVFK